MIGDIALINANAPEKKDTLNVAGQRAVTLTFATPAYTHVALLLGTYRAVHAWPAPDHVEFTVVHELLAPQDEWNVWRNLPLAEKLNGDTNLSYEFLWQAELYVGERYNNPRRLLRSKEHHSFCSELVGKVYSHFGLPFPGSPEHLMPISIAKEVRRDSRWGDVTDEDRGRLRTDPRYQRLHDTADTDAALRAQTALTGAKDAAKDYGVLAEPIEGLKRFGRWDVDTHQAGLQLWTLKSSQGSPVLSREAVEWLSLLLLDKVDSDLVDLYVSLGRASGT